MHLMWLEVQMEKIIRKTQPVICKEKWYLFKFDGYVCLFFIYYWCIWACIYIYTFLYVGTEEKIN